MVTNGCILRCFMLILGFVSLVFSTNVSGQRNISTKTELMEFNLKPLYNISEPKTELIIRNIEIIDETFDGVIEPFDKGKLVIELENTGPGRAQEVQIKLMDYPYDKFVQIDTFAFIPYLNKKQTVEVEFGIWAGIKPTQGTHTLEIKMSSLLGGQSVNYFDFEVVERSRVVSRSIAARQDAVDIGVITKKGKKRKDAIGLIIAVEEYENIENAEFAENDALYMEMYYKEVLGLDDDNIYSYVNSDVTRLFFDKVFDPVNGQLKGAVITDSTELFVYYSGHGIPSKDGKTVYLFPHNGIRSMVSSHGYDIDELYNSLASIGAKNTTVFMDACFSGASKASSKDGIKNIAGTKGIHIDTENKIWKNLENFDVFSSSAINQTSLSYDKSETGLFTYYLCKGLKGDADRNRNRQITKGELYDFIKKNVEKSSVGIAGKQIPLFNGDPKDVIVDFSNK